MGIAILSAGMRVKYCVETTSGTRPSAGFAALPDIIEIPDLNPAPATHQTTTLDALKMHTYIAGLQDVGGALTFNANDTIELHAAWDAMYAAYETGKASDKDLWIEITFPDGRDSFYFTAIPTKYGFGGAQVDSPVTTSVYLTPTNEPDFYTPST